MGKRLPAHGDVLAELERWGGERGWVGPDPYEGLNSPLGRVVPTRRGRQAVTQLYKRLPRRPPWPLRCQPTPNAKALALALSGYATPAGGYLPGAAAFLEQLPRRLQRLALPPKMAWGYPFQVQTRNIRYAPSSPNAIVTCFVVGALLDLYEADPVANHAALALALGARDFLVSLSRDSDHGRFFGYVEAGSDLIHNANVLVCANLARLHRHRPEEGVAELARDAAMTTLSLQRADGLWPYGEAANFRWTDNFHSAYTLEALCEVEEALGLGASDRIASGCHGWLAAFIEPDGWCRYFNDRRYPLEAHSCASAIDLLCRTGIGVWVERPIEVAYRIAARAIAELWLPGERRFAFKVTPRGRNERVFMRWTNAPMFRALARLASAEAVVPGSPPTRALVSQDEPGHPSPGRPEEHPG